MTSGTCCAATTAGCACNKAFSIPADVQHAQRTQHPLRRRPDGAYGVEVLRSLGSRRWFNAFAQEKTQHNLLDQ